MPTYDASDALNELFDEGSNDSGHNGTARPTGDAVEARTQALLDGPTAADAIDPVLRLADKLPRLEDVREVAEDDTSDLTDIEQQQRAQTESVIDTALAANDAALWVVALGLDRAAKGRWWRREYATWGAYVESRLGRSAVYGRQLRKNAPLALETAAATGTVPKPSHVKVTVKTEELHGRNAAVDLYRSVRDISADLGGKPTAANLMAVQQRLPSALPPLPEQQRAVIEAAARSTLLGQDEESEPGPGTGASIEAPTEQSETTPADAAPAGEPEDDIPDAEIVPEHLVTLKDALRTLNILNKTITKDVLAQAAADPSDPEEYQRLRAALVQKATALRNKALHAPAGRP
jgi:hypothetical protein